MRRAVLAFFLVFAMVMAPRAASAQIVLSISLEPPELPVYDQPPIPEPGYIWTPGYWAYGPDGYFWVPGTWVEPPEVGYLWTPGYWGWSGGTYLWHGGYWGPHIGFYGGVNYGYGYGGTGYEGGYWDHGHFSYNSTVNNFGGTHITNVYNKTVIVNNVTHVSYNGGSGGTNARPTPTELAAVHERHLSETPAQHTHIHAAASNHALLASVNHGHPAIAATSRPGAFSGRNVVPAHGAHAPAAAESHARPAEAAHPKHLATHGHTVTAARHYAGSGISRHQTHARPVAAAHHYPASRPAAPVHHEAYHPHVVHAAPHPAYHPHPMPAMHHAAPQHHAAPPHHEKKG